MKETGAEIVHHELPKVMGNRSQLIQLFQNLLGNALKYRGNAAPRISVSAVAKGNMWAFAVRDNGIGIEPQYFERIFAIFQRLHTRDEYPGTGIGLALCKKIVERAGGTIWLESEAGAGSTFHFTLPQVS
jgi:light-regulated signal transduction histidine kinase (bacteriophytochrome)